jgi:hypothetical protein
MVYVHIRMSMATPRNFIVDTNPFRMAGPPQWWLRKLYEFDPSLVVLPSRQSFVYRLAQRRRLNLAAKIVSDIMKEDADMKMMASYGLVPVTTIIATANWDNPLMFVELANRAPWRLGGADKVTSMLDAQEKAEEIRRAEKLDDSLTYLGKDAWRYYNKRIGVRGTYDLGRKGATPRR